MKSYFEILWCVTMAFVFIALFLGSFMVPLMLCSMFDSGWPLILILPMFSFAIWTCQKFAQAKEER